MNRMKYHGRLLRLAMVTAFALFSASAALAQSEGALKQRTYTGSVQLKTHRVSMPDDGMSNKELLKGYVQQLFDESLGKQPASRRAQNASSNLSENNLKLYNALKTEIVKIANGTITSTELSFTLSNVFPKVTWTAAELGLTQITSSNHSTAYNTAFSNLGVNVSTVMNALLADLPYELYWFDKTQGWAWSWGYYYYNSSSLEITGPLTISMKVSADYSSTGTTGTTTTNCPVDVVNTAISNAQTIVNNNSSLSPLPRLTAYKTEICSLVSYNDDAVGPNPPAYGDPWQLVWVFDGDEDTKVVCEGYSKAFKYLCDLSNFSDIDCFLATGTMSGGSGAGNHMWNVVKMDDGKSYLVDVTNSDAGTVGQGGELFMAYGPTGSYASGYTFKTTNPNIKYIYDNNTKSNFTESLLTLSSYAYIPSLTGASANGAYWSTYYNSTRNVQADANTTVYTVTVSGSTATLHEISDKIIKQGEGVVLKSTSSNITLAYTATAATGDFSSNALKGFDAETAISSSAYAGKVIYTLANESGLGFYKYYDNVSSIKYTSNTTLGANKAFLPLNAAVAGAIEFYLFTDETTGVSEKVTVNIENQASAQWYTLDGRKLAGHPAQKGIYIVNGKKIIVK